MEIHFHASSDIGKVRSANEDFFINEKIAEEEYLFAVADGMGGHLAGDVASRLASEKFLESYKTCRKKKLSIDESLEFSIRRANQAILKKGEEDPLKKGMGTTFSVLIIHRMRATIIHIGDSRIYFVRKNQIKRLTTDHTFVEKLVEDGRISQDEARDHPQKNVLYMSLGARDGMVPEIIKDFPLEDGDAFILCTDGLSNNVSESRIKEIVLSLLPEDAARELIVIANAGGGTDNITLQVVRVGSIESLEKTKPVKIPKPRKRWITVLSILGFCGVLVIFWIVYKGQIEGSAAPAGASEKTVQTDAPPPNWPASHEVKEINAEVLRDKNLSLADFRFAANQKVFIVKERTLYVFDLNSTALLKYPLGADQQVVPAATGDLLFFGKKEASNSLYELTSADGRTQSGFASGSPHGRLEPLFISEGVFLFRDATQLFVLRQWKQGAKGADPIFPLSEVLLDDTSRLEIKRIANDYVLTHYQPNEKTAKVFSIGKNFSRLTQVEGLNIDVPLAVEYFPDHSLVFYFADHSVRVLEGSQRTITRPYRFVNYQANIARILVDIETGWKILVADGSRLYLLSQP